MSYQFDYDGPLRQAFIEAAHEIMFTDSKSVGRTNPHLLSSAEDPEEMARYAGWEFGQAVRNREDIRVTSFASFTNQKQSGVSEVFSTLNAFNPLTNRREVFAEKVPAWALNLATDSVNARDTILMLEELDDLHQFIVGNVKSAIGKGNVTELHLLQKNRQGMKNILARLKRQYKVSDDIQFFIDISYAIKEQYLQKHLNTPTLSIP